MGRLVKEVIDVKLHPDNINRGRVNSQLESQHQIIKALQHTHIAKIPRHRYQHIKNKTTDNRDTKLSNRVIGQSRMGDHTV
jgi:hypothetical protein